MTTARLRAFAIKDLLQGLEEGSDVVYAKYEHKHHNAFRNFGSRVNDLMLKFMLGKPADLYVSSFFAARRFIVDEMLRYQNAYPYVIGLVLRATRNIKNVTVEHQDRKAGESGYTLSKLLACGSTVLRLSVKTAAVATMIGTGCAFLGSFMACIQIIKKLVNPMVPIVSVP